MRFTQFYAAPVSSASRAGLMTGQFAARAGLTGNAGWTGFPPEKETVAQRMKANGYRTACIGKWHLGSRPEYAPNNRGFDYFWGFLGGCIDSYSHFYYWGGPNVHDLWRNGEEIHCEGRFFTEETLREAKEFIRAGDRISWPGHLPAGEVRDQVAMNIDWFPTLLDLCGLDASGIDVDGASIVPLIRDGAAASPHNVLHFDFERQWAVRRGDWKLICNAIDVLPNDRNKTLEGLYLTNLKIDRTESENLIDRYPEKAQELLALRRAYEASLGKDKE